MGRWASLLVALPLLLGVVVAGGSYLAAAQSESQAARDYTRERMASVRVAFADAEARADVAARAWAQQDAVFGYARSQDPTTARAQFNDARIRALGVDAVVVTDPRGTVLFSRALPTSADPGGTRVATANPAPALNQTMTTGSARSWVATNDGARLLVARAIQLSDGGQGTNGMVTVFRFFDRQSLDALGQTAGAQISLRQLLPGEGEELDDTLIGSGWSRTTGRILLLDPAAMPSTVVEVRPATSAMSAPLVRARWIAVVAALVGGAAGSLATFTVVGRWQVALAELTSEITGLRLDSDGALQRLSEHKAEDPVGEAALVTAEALRAMQASARDEVARAREATAQERFGEAIIRGMGEGVVLLREDGVCQACNPAAALMLGIVARDVIGDRFAMQEVLGRELLDQLEELAMSPIPAEPIALERQGRSLTAAAEPFMRDGEPAGMLIRLHDVTALVQSEGLRRDLVSVVSHDLRTPLTVIASTVELLRARGGQSADEAHMYEMMERNVDRMQELMDDLLDSAALDSGQMQFDFDLLDLVQLAGEMAELHRPQADAKHIALYVDVPQQTLPLSADRRRIRQVLANLLGNAVKYSDDGARVWLRLREEGSMARVEVINTGHPITPDDQRRLFERFYRGEHSRRNSRGTGLGLAISRQIVEHHGGQLWLERSDAASNVFAFTLPLARTGVPSPQR